jgi:hypothetical protein
MSLLFFLRKEVGPDGRGERGFGTRTNWKEAMQQQRVTAAKVK